MRIYITNAQVPELAAFPPAARRALRQSAFQQMFAARPLLRWLPNGLFFVGVLIAVFTFDALPRSLYAWALGGPFSRKIIPICYILPLAWLGGSIGTQYLIHRSRIYLRHLVSSDEHETHTTA